MEKYKNKQFAIRVLYYFMGIMALALGITLNTKSLLGASPIISVAYTVSLISDLTSFGNFTLIWYCIFIAAEFIIRGKNRRWSDVLQLPFSIVFTRFLNLFGNFQLPTNNLVQKLLILFFAIIFTGIGAAVTVNMHFIMNPGDGIVHAIAGRIHKSMGTTKNIVDCACFCISLALGLIFKGNPLVGVGLGSVIAMIGVGRTIAVFNHFLKAPMAKHAGLDAQEL